jgi:ribosome maturation protein SDO1
MSKDIRKEHTDSVLDGRVIARYERGGHRFEIIIEPGAIDDLKTGKPVTISEKMPSEEVFKDAHKGDRASADVMKEVFGTENVITVATKIAIDGDVQLTTEQRRQMSESKRKQIIAIIARNAMNPQTGAPHPPARIEAAMEEARVKVDPFKPAEMQVNDVLAALRPLIPISFDKVRFAIKLSGEDYGKSYGDLKGLGKVMQEEWQPNGTWIGVIEIPAGMQNDLISKLNEKTKGNAELKLLKKGKE